MRSLLVALIFAVLSTPMAAMPSNYYLLHGKCTLPFDPAKDQDKINSSVFACVRGSATVDAFYIPSRTVGLAGRIDVHGSIHNGTRHAFFYESYHEQIASHVKEEQAYSRNQEYQTFAYQYGNPISDYFRAVVGQQRPAFGINKFPEIPLNQIFDPRYLWGLSKPGVNFIFDSQKQAQFELQWTTDQTYHFLKEQTNNYTVASRFMYDFSILGGTRTVFSILAKKSGEKRLGLGLVSVGPTENRFQAEWLRIYASLSNSLTSTVRGTLTHSTEGLNSPYQQLVRFTYEDPPGRPLRNFILFDDVAFQYRLFAYGARLNFFSKWSYLRILVAFKQDQTGKKRHRWIFGTGVGGQL